MLDAVSKQWKSIAAILAVAGSIFLYQATGRNVQVLADGKSIQGFSHGRDVGAVLDDLGIEHTLDDLINPPPEQQMRGVHQIQVVHAMPVILDDASGLQWIRATSKTPANIIADAGLRIYPGDRLWIDGQPEDMWVKVGRAVSRIRLVRGHQLTVMDANHVTRFRSGAVTIDQALFEVGFMLYEGDSIDPPLTTLLTDDQTISIRRASDLLISVDGRTMQVKAVGDTVGEALASAGIGLGGLDYTIPAVTDPIPLCREMQVIRVAEQILVELEPVPFETSYQPLETLELDSIQVVDSGTYGVLENRVRIRVEDGVEVSRQVDEARVVIEPKPRILGYGTKVVVRTLSTSYGTIEYWRAIPIYATSYSPCNLGVPYCGSRTASGKEVTRGTTGVIRSWYNLMWGWPVFVPDYGPGTIEDIGAGIAGRDWIDLGFTDGDFEPWHQWTTLYFLTPVPALDSIPWILP